MALSGADVYGSYTMGISTDGTTVCELGAATHIVYNGYSDIGGCNMSYDTDNLQFPVNLPGGVMTEQADFWAIFGPAQSVSLDTRAAPPNKGSNDKDDETAPSEEAVSSEEPDGAGEGIATISSTDGVATPIFNSNGTYRFFFELHSIEDKGTYTYEGGVLTLTNANDLEMTVQGAPTELHYVMSVSDQLTGDFTIEAADLST